MSLAALNIFRQTPGLGFASLRDGIQLLEGPGIGDTSGLLNVLLAIDIQVLEGHDIGDITSLLNMLLVERASDRHLGAWGPQHWQFWAAQCAAGRHSQTLSGFRLHKLLVPA